MSNILVSLNLPTVFRIGGLLLLLTAVAACTGRSPEKDFSTPTSLEERLSNQLAIAEAALAAGQISVARDLYVSLRQRFKSFPEPYIGLGNIALYTSDLDSASRYFRRGAELAFDSPAMRTRAQFGLGRVSLAEANSKRARAQFQRANKMRELAQDANIAPWIENGLGVSATLLGKYEHANDHFQQALLSSHEHPAIVANYVRMLHMSGNVDEAKRVYATKSQDFWLEGDAEILKELLKTPSPQDQTPSPQDHTGSRWKPTLFVRGTEIIAQEQQANGVSSISYSEYGDEQVTKSATGFQQLHIRSRSLSEPTKGEATIREPTELSVYLGQSAQVQLKRDTTTVIVVSPGIADVRLVSPRILYIVGKGVGRTSVALFDNDTRIEDWIVSVTADLQPLRTALANYDAFSNVRVEQVLRSVDLSGEVGSPASAERVLRLAAGALPDGTMINDNLQVVGPQQVNLEVQIAEVQRSISETLGINWEADGVFASTDITFRVGQLVRRTTQGSVSPALGLATGTAENGIATLVDALAEAGLATILARPNLTATSGETASFFSGGEFPMPIGIDDGVLLYDFKKFGVLLDFVPTIVDNNRIVLKVRPEVSEASLKDSVPLLPGVQIPIINVRRAETTVEVGDGESIVIAGLFRNSTNRQKDGIPVISDIPILENVFGATNVDAEELELLVTVTARLVGPNPLTSQRGQELAFPFQNKILGILLLGVRRAVAYDEEASEET